MLKLYGNAMSRAFRPLWMLEELGVPYEQITVNFATGETRKPEYLAINPNGHVPTLVDGDTIIWESMAINFYLAKKYDEGLQPKSLADEGRAIMWSFWAMTEVEAHVLKVLMNRVILAKEQRNSAEADEAEKKLAAPLAVLDGALQGKRYLLGDNFTVADLNVASVLSWARASKMDLAKYPNLGRWLGECLSRPAVKRAQGK